LSCCVVTHAISGAVRPAWNQRAVLSCVSCRTAAYAIDIIASSTICAVVKAQPLIAIEAEVGWVTLASAGGQIAGATTIAIRRGARL
jgi:hypothetical protein